MVEDSKLLWKFDYIPKFFNYPFFCNFKAHWVIFMFLIEFSISCLSFSIPIITSEISLLNLLSEDYMVWRECFKVTEAIYKLSTEISSYYICPDINVDINQVGHSEIDVEGHGKFVVDVVDSVEDYVQLMKSIFDFHKVFSELKFGYSIGFRIIHQF